MKIKHLIPIIALLIASCKKENLSLENQLSELPDETQTGANNVACLINGVAFKAGGGLFTKNKYARVEYENGGYRFFVSGYRNGKNYNSISIRSHRITLKNGDSGVVNPDTMGTGFINYSGGPELKTEDYNTTDVPPAQLHISKVDMLNRIVSGTFSFDAVSSSGLVVKARFGRFDMKFD